MAPMPRSPPFITTQGDPGRVSFVKMRRLGGHDRIGRLRRPRGPDGADQRRIRVVARPGAWISARRMPGSRSLSASAPGSARSSAPRWAARCSARRSCTGRTSSRRPCSRRWWRRSSGSRSSARSRASSRSSARSTLPLRPSCPNSRYYAVMGIAAGLIGRLYSRGFYGSVAPAPFPGPEMLKPAVAGVLVGLIGLAFPPASRPGTGGSSGAMADGLPDTALWMILAHPVREDPRRPHCPSARAAPVGSSARAW